MNFRLLIIIQQSFFLKLYTILRQPFITNDNLLESFFQTFKLW